MSYSYRNAFLGAEFKSANKRGSPVIKILLITKSELRTEIKEQKVVSIDAIEAFENFGIRYSAKINFISTPDTANKSVCLLGSNNNSILFYKTINSLHLSLSSCGYRCSERDLNIISHFLGI